MTRWPSSKSEAGGTGAVQLYVTEGDGCLDAVDVVL